MLKTAEISQLAGRYRLVLSRIFMVLVVLVLLFCGEDWGRAYWLSMVFRLCGFVLVVIACMGRIWSALYISGLKNVELVTDGPYSMMRNPLYFFSFLGAIGLGLFSENLWALFLLAGAFVIYYPFVVFSEEERLLELHGEHFQAYRSRTPSFIPKFSNFSEPEQYTVNARKFRRALVESAMFLLILAALAILREAQFRQIVF